MRPPGSLPAILRIFGMGIISILTLASFPSCSNKSERIAAIWTDAPELAIAAELFNARSGAGAVRLAYKREIAESLAAAKSAGGTESLPALIVGRRLDGAGLRDRLYSSDYILKGRLDRDALYPELLDGGVIEGKRALLPLSFNLPAIVFKRDSPAAGDGFTLSLEDLAAPSAAFSSAGGGPARMGFSPRWDARFVVTALDSGGARFGERPGRGQPELAWDPSGLSAALSELCAWSARVNGSTALEDDFRFKYLYSTPHRWLMDGRALYVYMDSSELFLASEEKREELDFRWYSSGGKVPISEGALYAGLVRGAPGRAIAESFLRWLLTPDAQKALLERTRVSGASSYSFGLLGGFSSIRSVNEGLLPAFYPALVGHAPPGGRLMAPSRLPPDWPSLRDAALVPWFLEASAKAAVKAAAQGAGPARTDPSLGLSTRIAEYRKRGARR